MLFIIFWSTTPDSADPDTDVADFHASELEMGSNLYP